MSVCVFWFLFVRYKYMCLVSEGDRVETCGSGRYSSRAEPHRDSDSLASRAAGQPWGACHTWLLRCRQGSCPGHPGPRPGAGSQRHLGSAHITEGLVGKLRQDEGCPVHVRVAGSELPLSHLLLPQLLHRHLHLVRGFLLLCVKPTWPGKSGRRGAACPQ